VRAHRQVRFSTVVSTNFQAMSFL